MNYQDELTTETGDKLTAIVKEEAEGSSSVEPEWGRIARQNEKEIEKDYQDWKAVNIGG